ncbi:MAG: hypothetical protein JRE92_06365, partial [Deltaproteobacteria bacterium]|nr:hypothetical protein [Deltaproteobacteria bacterium]
DQIAPPLQAVGHLELIPEMPAQNRLRLLCDAGHMGLFRSQRVLEKYYRRVADFLMTHSDYTITSYCTNPRGLRTGLKSIRAAELNR